MLAGMPHALLPDTFWLLTHTHTFPALPAIGVATGCGADASPLAALGPHVLQAQPVPRTSGPQQHVAVAQHQ